MREAVFRRYRRQLDEANPLPDLVMIDGGKAQLSAAASAMRELDLEAIPMVGVVKPPRFLPPMFRDLNGLAIWMAYSSFFTKLGGEAISDHYARLFARAG